jgi:hypothetical protein
VLETCAVNKRKKGKNDKPGVSSKAASEDKLWYPAVVDLVKAQHRDPECMAILQQLKLLKEGGMPALKLRESVKNGCGTYSCMRLMLRGNCAVRR